MEAEWEAKTFGTADLNPIAQMETLNRIQQRNKIRQQKKKPIVPVCRVIACHVYKAQAVPVHCEAQAYSMFDPMTVFLLTFVSASSRL